MRRLGSGEREGLLRANRLPQLCHGRGPTVMRINMVILAGFFDVGSISRQFEAAAGTPRYPPNPADKIFNTFEAAKRRPPCSISAIC
jgi:hypothetical protein